VLNLDQVAGGFTGSAEFQAKYGALDDTQFVTLLYNNVLHRAPDPAGLSGWLNVLETGGTRTSVVIGFSESPEYHGNEKAALEAYIQTVAPWDGNVLDGGDGSDTATYAQAAGPVTVDLGVAGPQETGSAGIDWLKNIENVVGSSFDDTLTASTVANTLTGGPGSDTFRFTTASASPPAAYDTITDFVHGQDKIDLSGLSGLGNALVSTTTVPGTIDPHTVLAVVAGGNTVLYANISASSEAAASADMKIHLIGVANLSDSDIQHV